MLQKGEVIKLVRCFLHEACGYLGIDDSKISISYISMPAPMQMVMLLKDSDDIIIDTNMLYCIAQANRYSTLRMDVYRVSRELFQRRKQITEGIEADAMDAIAFAYALSFLNGLGVVIPKNYTKELEPRIRHILNCEFQEHCLLHCSPDRMFPREFCYRAIKTKEARKAELKLHIKTTPRICAINVDNGEKGTESNPFENIDDACGFIKEQEIKALELDHYMSGVLAKRRFNYCPENNLYNIKWADGKCAYCHPEIPADAFIVNQLLSGKFSLKPNLYGRKFLYRGQSKYYDRCTPGLFRDSNQDYFLKEMVQYDELRAILASHPLVQLFEKGFDLWHDLFRLEVNYGGLAQHYYNKTRFLDLTSDIEAAKFFAVTDYNNKTDKYSPHTDTSELGVMYYYEISEPGAFQQNRQQTLSTIGKQIFMRSGNQHGFLLNMDKNTNFNLFPQVHKVFFRHDPEMSQRIYLESNQGSKYFPSDMLQKQWQRFIQQFESHPVVSLEAVKINVQDNKSSHETINSIIGKLDRLYEIKVDKSKKPKFDEDLMEQYYEDIKNGWWQDVFCHDIYFPSEDGVVYKDMLLHLPKDDRYASYFLRN